MLGFGLTRIVARRPAPELTYTLLDGSVVNTSHYLGKVVLVSFWATSCSACVAEMPQIAQAHRRWAPSGMHTLAVAMQYDPPVRVFDFAQAQQLPFGVVIDNTGGIAAGFGDVQQTPTTFLIDKRGRIARRYLGAPDFAALDRLISDLLAEA